MNKLWILIFLLFISCEIFKKDSYWKYPDDNPVEEFVEEKIEDLTGLDIDFTARSPEK